MSVGEWAGRDGHGGGMMKHIVVSKKIYHILHSQEVNKPQLMMLHYNLQVGDTQIKDRWWWMTHTLPEPLRDGPMQRTKDQRCRHCIMMGRIDGYVRAHSNTSVRRPYSD